MTSSMTGFASREAHGPYGQLTCELRSVNHRYLESGFRLPEELRSLEIELRQSVARELGRGKVDCSFHLRSAPRGDRELSIDTPALLRLMSAIKKIVVHQPFALINNPYGQINILDVLRWPGVLQDTTLDTDSLKTACRTLFAETLADLVANRAREGARLQELIEQRCGTLTKTVLAVRERIPELRIRLGQKLRERVAELAVTIDPQRLEQELLLLVQRADVDEELDRLNGHIEEIKHVINGHQAAGRRLDFLMQELNREANTLSSKSQELDTTRLAVDMKVLIEQMREQIQNIE